MRIAAFTLLLASSVLAPTAHATTWTSTGWVQFDIRMDNGETYIYPVLPNGTSLGGNCLYGRLRLAETGDRFNAVENGRRMMALLVTAKTMKLRANLGYDSDDGSNCRLAQLSIEWL